MRAIERTGDPRIVDGVSWPDGGYPSYFSVICGFDEFRDGRAGSISGLETPDEHTLVVRLEEPTGDLLHRFALPATAPIPEGAAAGHRDYGPFLVSSGPYMIEGSESRDLSLPPREQTPAAGFVEGVAEGVEVLEAGSLSLVRNPSWDPETDRGPRGRRAQTSRAWTTGSTIAWHRWDRRRSRAGPTSSAT